MNDIDKILNFILDPNNEKFADGYNILYSVFKKHIALTFLETDNVDDLFNEFLFSKILNKTKFYLKFKESDNNLALKYLKKTIYNFMLDIKIKNVKSNIESDINNNDNKQSNVNEILEHILYNGAFEKSKEFMLFWAIEVKEIDDALRSCFDKNELKILCNLFLSTNKESAIYAGEVTDEVRYKRRQRIKDRLFEFIKNYSFGMELFDFFIKNKLSEICKSLS